MTRDRSDVIAGLSASIAAGDKNPHYRRAATMTGGLPVYADIGGILVVTRDGEVVCVDLEQDVTTRETDTKWRLHALAVAARAHPALADLVPTRPSTAWTCEVCAGTGDFRGFLCGHCNSLGWVTTRNGTSSLDDVIALNPRGDIRRAAIPMFRERTAQQRLTSGFDILEDRTAVLCELFGRRRPTKTTYVRSIVENDLFTAVAIWLQFLRPEFLGAQPNDDFSSGVQLLADIWTTIAGKPDEPVEQVLPLLIVAEIVGGALCDAHRGRRLLGRPNLEVVEESREFASLRQCQSLGDLVRRARSLITT